MTLFELAPPIACKTPTSSCRSSNMFREDQICLFPVLLRIRIRARYSLILQLPGFASRTSEIY